MLCLGAMMAFAGGVLADAPKETLSDLNAEVIKDPTNSKLNLRYARLAEVEGKLRLALAAYERVVLNDPGNREGQAGFIRVRRKLEPPSTNFRAEIGAGYDTNPLNLHREPDGKPVFFAKLSMRDERLVRGIRWRTLADVSGEYTLDIGRLLYGYAGLQSGPLIDLSPRLTVHPALGGAVATLDKRLFYTEGNASLTFEGRFAGAFQALRLRGGYRSYGRGMTSNEGMFADAVGRMTFPNAFGGKGAIVVSPWARWSGAGGSVRNEVNDEITPGKYVEWGLELGYYIRPVADLTLGASIAARQRLFLETRVTGKRREDNYIAPGFNATRSNVLSCACDLVLDYRYRINNSNEPLADYNAHRVSVSFASRF